MPALLPEDVMDWSVIERIMCDVITPGDQLYRLVMATIRHCRTMSGARGTACRMRRYLRFLQRTGGRAARGHP